MTEKKRCFVIMPFSKTNEEHTEEYWTRHFNDFLKPLIEQSGEFKAYRSEALRGDILKSIITSLVNDPIVVADLTDHNSNVYWELGVRQSFKHGTITIKEENTKIPFDLGTKGTLTYYPDDHIKNSQFGRDFQAALIDCLEHPERPDSHVLETISGRGTIYEIIMRDETIRKLDSLMLEIEFNLAMILATRESLEKGVKGASTARLHTSAFELLSSHRYLNQDKEFYNFVLHLLNRFNAYNGQLPFWITNPPGFQQWFLKSFKEEGKELTEFRERIISIQKDFTLS